MSQGNLSINNFKVPFYPLCPLFTIKSIYYKNFTCYVTCYFSYINNLQAKFVSPTKSVVCKSRTTTWPPPSCAKGVARFLHPLRPDDLLAFEQLNGEVKNYIWKLAELMNRSHIR